MLTNEEIKKLRYKMGGFRISRECIDHILMLYLFCPNPNIGVLVMALEWFEDNEEYLHEPDHKIMEIITTIQGFPIQPMKPWYPRDNMQNTKKGSPEIAKEWMTKIRECVTKMKRVQNA